MIAGVAPALNPRVANTPRAFGVHCCIDERNTNVASLIHPDRS